MFVNKNKDGSFNVCGRKIADLRKRCHPKMSQRELANQLQLLGVNFDKNAIQRIESGKRFVTDIELKAIAEFFDVTADELLQD